MNCMKCGREIGQDQVFCENCLAVMEQYPVKPDTLVQIPRRPAAVKKVRQRRQTAEEQIALLEKRCHRRTVALVIAVLMLVGVMTAAALTIYELDVQRFLGQNYSSSEAPFSFMAEK